MSRVLAIGFIGRPKNSVHITFFFYPLCKIDSVSTKIVWLLFQTGFFFALSVYINVFRHLLLLLYQSFPEGYIMLHNLQNSLDFHHHISRFEKGEKVKKKLGIKDFFL